MVDQTVSEALAKPAAAAGPGRDFWRGIAVPAALVVIWSAASHLGLVDSRLLVPPERVALVPFLDADGRELWLGITASVLRMLAGFTIGILAGGALGLLMGVSRFAERGIAPSFTAVRQITLFAWIPLLTAWFGNGEAAKIVFIALSAGFPMALNTHQGLRDIPIAFVEVARVLRLSRRRLLTQVLVPSALPAIAIGIEIALINAWIGTVGAEYAMGLGRGVGAFLAEGREQFRMDIVIVGVLTLALVGFVLNTLLRAGVARLMPASGNSRR
ncbi:MAG: putative alkanesulfonate transport protein superfamily, inner rane component [Rhodospirillales bacterium]|jgi:sulfonate transport system permease protein|nr:putative alkanesulfonate transport protein superfamily, inner rane component [Rhodospirillales bacterium]